MIWQLKIVGRRKLACKFITEISGDLCCIRLAVLSSEGYRGTRKGIHFYQWRNDCFWLPRNWRKWALGRINFYVSPLRQKFSIFYTFCNSELFPRRTEKECGCYFLRTDFNFHWLLWKLIFENGPLKVYTQWRWTGCSKLPPKNVGRVFWLVDRWLARNVISWGEGFQISSPNRCRKHHPAYPS